MAHASDDPYPAGRAPTHPESLRIRTSDMLDQRTLGTQGLTVSAIGLG
jgi:hypothetical protein